VRLVVYRSRDGTSLWEVSARGSGLHRVSPELTTRSDFQICAHPTLAARPQAATFSNDDICEVYAGLFPPD
jgi:hypothetical protein